MGISTALKLVTASLGVAGIAGIQDPSFDYQMALPTQTAMAMTATVDGQKATSADTVTVNFRNAKANDVLRWLEKRGVSYIVDDADIKDRTISLNLVEVSTNEALDAIASALGGRWERQGPIRVFAKGRAPLGGQLVFGQTVAPTGNWNSLPTGVATVAPFQSKELLVVPPARVNLEEKVVVGTTVPRPAEVTTLKELPVIGELFRVPPVPGESAPGFFVPRGTSDKVLEAFQKAFKSEKFTKEFDAEKFAKEFEKSFDAEKFLKEFEKNFDAEKFARELARALNQKGMVEELRSQLKGLDRLEMLEVPVAGELSKSEQFRVQRDALRAQADVLRVQGEVQKLEKDRLNQRFEAVRKAREANVARSKEGARWRLMKVEDFLKSITPEQKAKHKKQGFLKLSDLSSAQKEMIGAVRYTSKFSMVLVKDGEKITIKND